MYFCIVQKDFLVPSELGIYTFKVVVKRVRIFTVQCILAYPNVFGQAALFLI